MANSAKKKKKGKKENARMIERMRGEPLSPHNSNGALPRDDLRKLNNSSTHDLLTRALHNARHKPKLLPRLLRTKHARRQRQLAQQRRPPSTNDLRHARERARVRRQPHVHLLDTERGVRRGPAHVDGAEQVEREPVRWAVHGRYYRLRDARRRADCVLEGEEVRAG